MTALTTNPMHSYPHAMYAKQGWRYDAKVTATMVEDMIFDPILAAKVLLDIEIPPHQQLRLLWMWSTFFTIDDSGFSTGKTFTNAIVMSLRSVLMPGRVSGVLAGTFRQGKLTFQHVERWSHTSKIFRSCFQKQRGKPRILHSSEGFEAHFRGMARIRVLPPNFDQDSESLRGERWNDGYFDEWTKYGSLSAITKTLIGRVTMNNEFNDQCPVRQNHAHFTSTPGYTHEPCYAMVERVDEHMARGSKKYSRFTTNYRHVPKKKRWKSFVDRNIIYTMQTMNPLGVVKSEIDGRWQKDSQSYYLHSTIELVRQFYLPSLKRLYDQDVYVGAFDTARGHGDANRPEGDDFSLSIWRIPFGSAESSDYPCFQIRKNNINAANMAGIVHEANLDFQLALLMYDPGGGGLFVRDELMKTTQRIKNVETQVCPILEFAHTTGIAGAEILIPFRRSAWHIKNMLWQNLSSDSMLLNQAHGKFRGAIENHNVILPPKWTAWNELDVTQNIDEMRTYLAKMTGLSPLERVKAELDLAVRQLVHVDVLRDKNGIPIQDSYGMYKFKSKRKKDAAYSMMYGYLTVLIWKELLRRNIIGDSQEGSFVALSSDF